MKRVRKTLSVLLCLIALCVSAFLVGCDGNGDNGGNGGNGGGETPAPVPASIAITNDATVKPGVVTLTVEVQPTGADASFTSVLTGEHEYIVLEDNEIGISEDTPDEYEFTVEVTSTKATNVKGSKTFKVDNRPPNGLHITTVQREIDAQKNGGKLQLAYTMVPQADVKFELAEAVAGDAVTEGGEISVTDNLINNGTRFTVVATATDAEENDYREEIAMRVKNEIERPIATEADLLAIWTGNNPESIARMQNHYKLTANIRLTENWKAIGFKGGEAYEQFNGRFNGNGYTISNFNMNAGWNGGFFYYIGESGVVENLTLESDKEEGKGLSGMYAGPFAGYMFGTVRNCVADVRVTASINGNSVVQPIGTFLGTVGEVGRIINCFAYGKAYAAEGKREDNYKSGFVASVPGTLSQCVISCYMPEGTADFIVGRRESNSSALEQGMTVIQSPQTLMTASTYPVPDGDNNGFDRDIWRIKDGVYPMLKNASFREPAAIAVTVGGQTANETLTLWHGTHSIEAVIVDADNETDGVSQSFGAKVVSDAAEGAFGISGNAIAVDGTKLSSGDKCTLTVYSAVSPEIKNEIEITYEGQLAVAVKNDVPTSMTFTASGDNTLDLSEYVQIISGASANVTYAITTAAAGVSIDATTGVITLSSACDNTATFAVTVTATDGGDSASSDPIEFTIVNNEFKEISTAEDFLAIWTGDNAESRIRMHNNYIFMSDITIASGTFTKLGSKTWDNDTRAYVGTGFFGTLDGNGHELYFAGQINIGWNSGLITAIEADGVLKNLKLSASIKGAVTGAVGILYGTIENCIFNVAVESINAGNASGIAVGALNAGAVMRNVIAIGGVTGMGEKNAIFGKTNGTTAAKPATVENIYGIEGKVNFASGQDKENCNETNIVLKTEAELKVAQTEGGIYDGWDTTVWKFTDGQMPALRRGCTKPTA